MTEPSAPGSPAAPLGGHRFQPVSRGIAMAIGGCSLQRGTATSSGSGTAHPRAPAGIGPGLRRATDPSLLPGDGQMLHGGSVSSGFRLTRARCHRLPCQRSDLEPSATVYASSPIGANEISAVMRGNRSWGMPQVSEQNRTICDRRPSPTLAHADERT
jgi:hypothetical protein